MKWEEAKDVPRPVCWIRKTKVPHIEFMICRVSNYGVGLDGGQFIFFDKEKAGSNPNINDFEFSIDGRTWDSMRRSP